MGLDFTYDVGRVETMAQQAVALDFVNNPHVALHQSLISTAHELLFVLNLPQDSAQMDAYCANISINPLRTKDGVTVTFRTPTNAQPRPGQEEVARTRTKLVFQDALQKYLGDTVVAQVEII